MLTISKSRHFGKELPGDSIKDTLIIRDTLNNSTSRLVTDHVGFSNHMAIGSIPNLNGAYFTISHLSSVFSTKDTFTGILLIWDFESAIQAANRQNGFPSLCIRRFPQIGSRRRRIKQTDNR